MAQEDYVIADQAGVSFLADLNNTLAAIVSNNSGATEPTTMYAYQLWADTNAGILKQRNSTNNAWIDILRLTGITSVDIRNAPAGGIGAFNVQAALNELDTDKYAKAGGTMTGELTINLNTPSDVVYNNGHMELITTNGSDVSMGFHRGGLSACQLRHESNGLILSGTERANPANFLVLGSAFSDAAQSTAVNALTRKDYVDGLKVISKEFESSEQTITSGGLLSLTHGLGQAPKTYQLVLKCDNAGGGDGFDNGDLLFVDLGSVNRMNSIYFTATQIFFRFTNDSQCWQLGRKDTGAAANINNSRWKLIVRAFA